jgi:hypothetical protein
MGKPSRLRPMGRRALVAAALSAAVPGALAFAAVSFAHGGNPDSHVGFHSYGGKNCTYEAYSIVNYPAPATALSYTYIQTPSCQNGYAELYAAAARTDGTLWFHYTGWVVGPTAQWFYSVPNACQMIGYQHRMSVAGVDTSSNVTTNARGC